MTVLDRPLATAALPEPFVRWFASRGWTPRAHQLELLAKARARRSVLLIAPTGAGKTLAGFLPTLVELSTPEPRRRSAPSPAEPGLARVPHDHAQVGQARLATGEGWGEEWQQAPGMPSPPSPSPPPQGGREPCGTAAA